MRWEELTAPQFAAAVEDCEGVAVIPLGVIEKHGNHLPVGMDYFAAKAIAEGGAELEAAIVVPPYWLGQIHEARHQPGTIALPVRLLLTVLEALCGEVARNGLRKIVIINGHGGNRQLLDLFAQMMLERKRDYMVYIMPIAAYRPDAQQWEKMRKDELDGHGGEVETSKLLHIHPGLVHMDAVAPPSEGEPQQRWQELPKGLFTGIDWYTAFPNHYQGYGASGSADKGRFLVDYAIKAAAGFLRQVKDDTVRPAVLAEFYDRAEKPKL